MIGDGFGRPGVVEEDREVEAGAGGGSRAGPEDKGLPAAVLARSCFPCEVALEALGRAGLSGAASRPVGLCSEAGLASLLAHRGAEFEGRKG